MKRILCFILAVILVLSVSGVAYAATPRIVTIKPSLTFDGTTATCRATVVGGCYYHEKKNLL